jgi:hypothetical protein
MKTTVVFTQLFPNEAYEHDRLLERTLDMLCEQYGPLKAVDSDLSIYEIVVRHNLEGYLSYASCRSNCEVKVWDTQRDIVTGNINETYYDIVIEFPCELDALIFKLSV